MIGEVTFPIGTQFYQPDRTIMSFGYFSFNFAFVQVFRSSAIYFGIVCILGVSFNLGILLLYLSTKKVVCIEILVLFLGPRGPLIEPLSVHPSRPVPSTRNNFS